MSGDAGTGTAAEPVTCSPGDAPRLWEWLTSRGGVAVWPSVNLANLGKRWFTPVRQADGQPTPKPSWEAASQPARIVTDPAEVEVIEPREVRRFRVAVRPGSQGLVLKLTDASTRKVRQACARAGADAWYTFDYGTQEAVILVPGTRRPLSAMLPSPPAAAEGIDRA